jgi:predicted nucleotidyltransferase
MRDVILEKLREVEQTHRVRVLYAVESGSRAWGFASPDSDWDVRFIFARHPHDVLRVHPVRDVIEEMDGDLDVSGWELRKALALYLKTNPPLFEWLDSPIVYLDDKHFAAELRALATRYFSPRACFQHYRAMASNNMRAYLQGETVRLKKYLYVLRPVLACDWILARSAMPPTAFATLLDAQLAPGSVRDEVERLLAAKRTAAEVADGPRLPALHTFLEQALARFEMQEVPAARADASELDALLRRTLWRAWPNLDDWR